MKIKYRDENVILYSQHTLSIIVSIVGIIAFFISFFFSEKFKTQNPYFIYVWIYSSSIFVFLGFFISLYQRNNKITFDFKTQKINIKELFSGRIHHFSVNFEKIKEFQIFHRKQNENQKGHCDLYIIDSKNNTILLCELSNEHKIRSLVKKFSQKTNKQINIYSENNQFIDSNSENIAIKKEFPDNYWNTKQSEYMPNHLLRESEKGFLNVNEAKTDKICWGFKQQTLLAFISSMLAIGLVLLFSLFIIPSRGYTFWISIFLFISSVYLFSSVVMLLYSFFAQSTVFIGKENIIFETTIFNSVLVSQAIPRQKIAYIEGSLDSVKRNELVLLTKDGFDIIFSHPKKIYRPDLEELKNNILIIDTRPLLSHQRYFLQRKLHEALK